MMATSKKIDSKILNKEIALAPPSFSHEDSSIIIDSKHNYPYYPNNEHLALSNPSKDPSFQLPHRLVWNGCKTLNYQTVWHSQSPGTQEPLFLPSFT